jgi:hypothetical protein
MKFFDFKSFERFVGIAIKMWEGKRGGGGKTVLGPGAPHEK